MIANFRVSQALQHGTTLSRETKTSRTVSWPSKLNTFHATGAYLVPWPKSFRPLATSSTFSYSASDVRINDALHFQFCDNKHKIEQIKSPYQNFRASCDCCMNSKLKEYEKSLELSTKVTSSQACCLYIRGSSTRDY